VCGLEDVQTTLGYDPDYFFYHNSGSKIATNDLKSWFTNDDATDCPITEYEVFETKYSYYKG
jgi:hypothetical protein